MEYFNYRPISLINADLKIYAKALALQLEKVVGKLNNLHQTGFMKGRLSLDNIRRLLHIIEQQKPISQKGFFSWMHKMLLTN